MIYSGISVSKSKEQARMRLEEASKLAKLNPSDYAVEIRDNGGVLHSIKYNYKEREYGSNATIDGINGCIIHMNRLQAKGEQTTNDAFKNTGVNDFIHIFIPQGYYTKRRTIVFAGIDNVMVPVTIPLNAEGHGAEETDFFPRLRDVTNEIFDENDQLVIIDFLRRNWEKIRRCSETGLLSKAPAQEARSYICRELTPKGIVTQLESKVFTLFRPSYAAMNF